MYLFLVCKRTKMNGKEEQFDKRSFCSLFHFGRMKGFVFFLSLVNVLQLCIRTF